MIRMRPLVLLGLLVVAGPLFLDGCASKSGTSGGVTATPPKPRLEERVAAAPVQEIPPPPQEAPIPLRSAEMAARNATGEQNIPFPDVLFDFDQYVLRDDALTSVEANAKRLKDNRVTKVLLEGRCDEVGTSEYNLVLGERRALSVNGISNRWGSLNSRWMSLATVKTVRCASSTIQSAGRRIAVSIS